MKLLLITKTKMINKIFDLICAKLSIEIKVQEHTDVNEKFDFIVVDQEYIDDRFNIVKQHCTKIGAITNEELPFDKSRDFLVPRPFLPHDLQDIIEEQIEVIKEEKVLEQKHQTNLQKKSHLLDEYDEDDTIGLTSYIEELADDVANDIEDESDESIVSLAALKDGGILDRSELGKISTILKEDDVENRFLKDFQESDSLDENDWKDLSEIIDEALTEVSDYEFDVDYSQGINLILEKYNVEELRPLLSKLNQGVLEKLTNGETIDLKLSLRG